jgi:gamma-polyglutamate biosynthesis protein CapA
MNNQESVPHSITFFGDLFPSNHPYTTGFGLGDNFSLLMTEEVKDQIRQITGNSSIVFANLESPVMDGPDARKTSKPFQINESTLPILKNTGINLLSLANNHILEQGYEGFMSTIKTLARHDYRFIGELVDQKPKIAYYMQGSTKIGFAAFNDIHDLNDSQYISGYSVESVDETIAKMKQEKADTVIISIHWGKEYFDIPSFDQIRDSRHFIDNGANIIIGHHPHIIQPVEEYKNGLIIYSLGNFIFDFLFCNTVRKGLAVNVHFEGKVMKGYDLYPLELGYDHLVSIGNMARIRETNANLLKKMKEMEKKGPEKFNTIYRKKSCWNHFIFRIYMKIYVTWLLITKKKRMSIFKTLWSNISLKFQ